MRCQLDQECLISLVGERLDVGSLLLVTTIDQSHHLRKLFFVDKTGIHGMVLEKLHDLRKCKLSYLVLKLFKAELLQCVRSMSRVLILGEDVAPEFLVLFHELEGHVAIALLFLRNVDIDDLFGFECASLLQVILPDRNELVLRPIGNAKLSPFILDYYLGTSLALL